MNGSIAEIILSVLVVLGGFTLLFYHPIQRFFRRRSELKDYQPQQEAQPIRNLTPGEIAKLESMIKSNSVFSPIYVIVFVIILIYAFANLNYRSTGTTDSTQFIPFLLLLIPILITFAIFYQNREKAKKMKQDLILPVYKVSGKAYIESHSSRYSRELFITVRGVMFDGKQRLSSGTILFDEVNQDQKVVIEYSPNSKYVWKVIKKPEDFMNLEVGFVVSKG